MYLDNERVLSCSFVGRSNGCLGLTIEKTSGFGGGNKVIVKFAKVIGKFGRLCLMLWLKVLSI